MRNLDVINCVATMSVCTDTLGNVTGCAYSSYIFRIKLLLLARPVDCMYSGTHLVLLE